MEKYRAITHSWTETSKFESHWINGWFAPGEGYGTYFQCLNLFCFNKTSNEQFKVSVKQNEVPTEKNSSRASIFATKASYISN